MGSGYLEKFVACLIVLLVGITSRIAAQLLGERTIRNNLHLRSPLLKRISIHCLDGVWYCL